MLRATKRAKIVATIGPVTESREMLEKLVNAGLNVCRLNMSHGDHVEHGARIKNIQATAKKMGVPLPILFDLSGPKIRTGEYTTDRITIEAGKEIILTTDKHVGDENRIHVNYPKLPQEVKPGTTVLLDDGKKRLEVISIKGNDILCKIIAGGELKGRRGVNVPGAYLTIETITSKDKKDLAFGLAAGVDMVALSFVRRAEDIRDLRKVMKKLGRIVPIITKVETQEAIENIDEIIAETDGIMVARGDLACEVPTEKVPLYQKDMIRKCNELGKPVIVATQMMESMISSPVPTRAEVSDVANAIADGCDAVMLSEESTLGRHPIAAVSMMARIAETYDRHYEEKMCVDCVSVEDSISESVTHTAREVGASLIVAMTESGTTARLVARFQPPCPIVALTPNDDAVRMLELTRGVYPYKVKKSSTLNDAIKFVQKHVVEHNLVKKGELVVITAGLEFGVQGTTNMVLVIRA